MLKCTFCLELKSIDSFSKDKYKATGRRSQCKECNKKDHIKRYINDPEGQKNRSNIYRNELRKNNPEKLKLSQRKTSLKKNYNITLEEYNIKLKEQDSLCFICHTASKTKNLAVDHCHKTGKIRKLLCSKCNTTLGLLNEDLDLIDNLKKYLQLHLEE